MRKKVGYIALTIALIGACGLIENAKGSVIPILHYFNTDKPAYNPTENIQINASWDLTYNNITEISYVQIKLLHENGTLLWNSSEYPEIGSFQKNWTVNISTLQVTLENNSVNFTVQFYLYYWNFGVTPPAHVVLSEKTVSIRNSINKDNTIDDSDYGDLLDNIPFGNLFLIPLFVGIAILIGKTIKKKENLG